MVIASKLMVLDPVEEAIVEPSVLAPRLDTLHGKVIGLYSNDKLNAANLLDAIYDVLAERFEVATAYRVNKGDASRPAEPDLLGDFSNEVDVALLANGD